MKRKRIISILLLFSILLGYFTPFLNISYAKPKKKPIIYDYRDFVKIYLKNKRGYSNLKTPTPIFTIEADGKKVLVKPDKDMFAGKKKEPHGKLNEVPLLQYTDDEGNEKDFVVPVGTEIKLDASPSIGGRKSHKHPRGKIIRYDWQMGEAYNTKTKRWEEGFKKKSKWNKKKTPSFKVTKPGDYFIFLNVMDDFNKLGKKESFHNWSENGNWRVSKTIEEAKFNIRNKI